MNTVLFIQATLALPNKWDSPSLILSEVSGEPLFNSMLKRLKKSKRLNQIYVVTSSNACDDQIEKIVNTINQETADTAIKLSLLRIPNDSPYAFKEENIFLGRGNFIYPLSLCGMNSVEGFLKYTENLNIDTALMLDIDDTLLLETDFLDKAIERYINEEIRIGPLTILPMTKITEGYRHLKNKKEKEYKIDIQGLDTIIDHLKNCYTYSEEYLKKIRNIKESTLSEQKNRLIPLGELIGYCREKNRREKNVVFPELINNQANFFPLYHQNHLAQIKEAYNDLASLNLDNFFETSKKSLSNLSQEMPGYLEIELSSRCNLSCPSCPQTKLTRPKTEMDLNQYQKIIDAAVEIPFLSLSGFGEPTLHPQLIEAIRYAKNKRFLRVCLETNGTKIDEQLIEQL
ncbi:radical SAM protein, partial [Candidatus Auribacterota bacterium]